MLVLAVVALLAAAPSSSWPSEEEEEEEEDDDDDDDKMDTTSPSRKAFGPIASNPSMSMSKDMPAKYGPTCRTSETAGRS